MNYVCLIHCLFVCSLCTSIKLSPNVSTTPIKAMGRQQCLPLSVVQLIGKHCLKPRCRNGVVDMFGLSVQGVCTSSICTKVNVQIGASQHISHPC